MARRRQGPLASLRRPPSFDRQRSRRSPKSMRSRHRRHDEHRQHLPPTSASSRWRHSIRCRRMGRQRTAWQAALGQRPYLRRAMTTPSKKAMASEWSGASSVTWRNRSANRGDRRSSPRAESSRTSSVMCRISSAAAMIRDSWVDGSLHASVMVLSSLGPAGGKPTASRTAAFRRLIDQDTWNLGAGVRI